MPQTFINDFLNTLQKVVGTFEAVSLEAMDEKKTQLDAMRPLPRETLKSLAQKLRVEEVHNSTAIEGNSLTLGETALVLEKGITVEGKPLKDHLEVVGYDEGLSFIKQIVQHPKEHPLSEDLVCDVHRLMFKKMSGLGEMRDYGIGVYRTTQVFITGSRHVPPSAQKVAPLMKALMNYLQSQNGAMHPLRLAAAWHFGFTFIHPFVDGNGRTARLIMNLILLRGGYPLTIIPLARRARYMNALEKASVERNGKPFMEFLIECIEEVFKLYFQAANRDT